MADDEPQQDPLAGPTVAGGQETSDNRRKRKRPINRPSREQCIERVSSCIQQALLISTNEDFRQKAFRTMSVTNAQEAKDFVKRKMNGYFDQQIGNNAAPDVKVETASSISLLSDETPSQYRSSSTSSSQVGETVLPGTPRYLAASQVGESTLPGTPRYSAASQVGESILPGTPRYSEVRRWYTRSATPSRPNSQSLSQRWP